QEAENGLEGVTLWESWKPHFIWMDMRMPVMDGYEATRQIRAREKQIGVDKKWSNSLGSMQDNSATVIVALTASAFEEELDHLSEAGCDDCVIKPFREEVILEKMAQYLGVRYLYEQSTSTTVSSKVASRPPLTSEALAVMPADWIVQLHQAASSLDPSWMNELIEQIPDYHQSLAIALTDLVDDFRFDRIMDLTQLATP
ncbi:MAG TPA: response regulator, partial [Coleofasciculaceae cyanobacterium]